MKRLLLLAFLAGCTDTTALVPSVSLRIANGADEVRATTVALEIVAADAQEMRISEGSLDNVPFIPFAAVSLWTLPPGDGWRILKVEVRFTDGRTRVAVDSILLSEHVYVSPAGDDAASGSYLTPKQTIAAAVRTAKAEARARVRLFEGVYSPATGEPFPVRLPSDLTLESVEPTKPSVLDAQRSAGVIHIDSANGVTLQDIIIRGGNAAQGGGVFSRESSWLGYRLVIEDNVATSQGAGIYVTAGQLVLRQSLVARNSSGDVDAHGIWIAAGFALIHNNVLAFQDGNGLLVGGSSTADVRNNIFYMNGIPATRGRGICEVSSPHRTTIRYNIFWGNAIAAVLMSGSGDLTAAEANDLSMSDSVEGNLAVDPAFVDAAAGDYRLTVGSPAIDSGDPNPAFNDADGSRNDIGHRGGR